MYKKKRKKIRSHKEGKRDLKHKKYIIQDNKRGNYYRQNLPLDNEPTHQAIHVISGDETLARHNSSSQEAYIRLAY